MDLNESSPRHRASTSAVLEFAWDAGTFHAQHVMAALGLTRSTALSALDTLLEVGLVRELPSAVGEGGYRMGRPARRFELRGDAGVVIGVDAGDRQVTAVAADLTGQPLARTALTLLPYIDEDDNSRVDADPQERRDAARQAIDDVLAQAGRSREDVVGVGVGIPAPVDGRGRSPAHPSGFWDYMNAGLRSSLAEVFPAVRVENDASLAAIAEATLGAARGNDHFVAMLSGRRLGSGVFQEGRLVRGANGAVGELAALAYVTDIGGAWGLGQLAERWVLAARQEGRVPAGHPWSALPLHDLTAEAILAQAQLADPVTEPLLRELGSKLGLICSVVARFHDPDLIIVCGAMVGALGEVIELARGHVASDSQLPPPQIVASTLGGDVVSLGAISAGREAAREVVLRTLARPSIR